VRALPVRQPELKQARKARRRATKASAVLLGMGGESGLWVEVSSIQITVTPAVQSFRRSGVRS